jgi:anhydro-N-acetylmuramic acid kinase
MKEKYNLNVIVPQKEIIEYKEALIFALMGVLRVRNEDNILAMVTGSDEDHSAGRLHYPE